MYRLISRISISVLLPLVAGASIYVYARPHRTVFMDWFGFEKRYQAGLIPEIASNLPDFLWLFSLCNLFGIIWHSQFRHVIAWSLLAFVLAVGSEFAQKSRVIPGTYDPADIASYMLALLVSPFIHIQFHNQNRYYHYETRA